MNTIIFKKTHAELIINSPKYGIKTVLIDLDDVDKIKNFTWRIHNKLFYISTFEKGNRQNRKLYLLHRYIMNCPDDLVVDHINHNTLDNRKCNLRICQQVKNMQNRLTLSQYGSRNVTWHKRDKKWQVSLKINGKNIYFGQFDNYNEAKKVAKEARIKYFTHSIESEV